MIGRENNNLVEFKDLSNPSITGHVRWNPVTAKWQAYVSDSPISVADFGDFKDRDKVEAIDTVTRWMKNR